MIFFMAVFATLEIMKCYMSLREKIGTFSIVHSIDHATLNGSVNLVSALKLIFVLFSCNIYYVLHNT